MPRLLIKLTEEKRGRLDVQHYCRSRLVCRPAILGEFTALVLAFCISPEELLQPLICFAFVSISNKNLPQVNINTLRWLEEG
jgi:hypothetical protein